MKDHGWDVGEGQRCVDGALHERPPVVVLDVAMPPILVHGDGLREPLLGEITHSVVVRIRHEELAAIVITSVLFSPCHQTGAIPRHLQILGHCTERNFSETLCMKWTVRDPSDDCVVLSRDDHRSVRGVSNVWKRLW